MNLALSFPLIASSFGAGFLVSLSPCCFPMIPIVLGYFGTQAGNGKKGHILAFFVGKVIAFISLGFAAVKLGEIFGFSSQSPTVLITTGLILLIFGGFSFLSFLPRIFSHWNGLTRKWNAEGTSLVAALLLGITTALISSPCSTPILGTILMSLATEGSVVQGSLSMLSFSLGAAFIFLLVGFGLVSIKALPQKGPWMKWIHRCSSLAIIAIGIFYLGKGIFLGWSAG